MAKTQRLLSLLQLLSNYRYPVKAEILAERLNVSIRTIYRDIDMLCCQGAMIEGARGIGYQLRKEFSLPTSLLSKEEVEALILGIRWVTKHTDTSLSNSALSALMKISSMIPSQQKSDLHNTPLWVISQKKVPQQNQFLMTIRKAIRLEKPILVHYQNKHNIFSERIISPIAVGFFGQNVVIAAWCELKQDFRHFRLDRILQMSLLEKNYPQSHASLLSNWRRHEGIVPEKHY
ncbi:helix-turn-helix transcriptional regulator [Rodentibacter caecimuris]|uniref:helix-turn-helix transcriptional regulator n=1 Tax=Rodentibacter caecimuris TaxID=1796644 RepID=UPI00098788A7|nr:hypothetical protein BKG97_09480 [Rodentibacter heylii]